MSGKVASITGVTGQDGADLARSRVMPATRDRGLEDTYRMLLAEGADRRSRAMSGVVT